MRLTITGAAVTVDLARRTLVGTVYRYGETGLTSAGPLAVDAAMPLPPVGLPMSLEHDRGVVRGHIALVDNTPERLRVAVRVVDGELGDQALAEAANRSRAALSLDIEDADVIDGSIISGRWVAIGQVEAPAFNSARIDQIAASRHHPHGRNTMTEAQQARLDELRAQENLSTEEAAELAQLRVLAGEDGTDQAPAAPAAPATTAHVAASVPAVPSGVPARRAPARTAHRAGALDQFVSTIVASLQPGGGGAAAITAALVDVTETQHGANIEAPAWSGELWSGLQYEAEFTPLLNSGPLTNWEGRGWRWVTKPEIADYAGDKAAIPSGALATEPSSYEAARMAAGHDIDRKFYDFPNEAFLRAYVEAVRESWAVKLDDKVRAWIEANAVVAGTNAGSVLKAAARAVLAVKRARLGRASFVVVSDADFENLMDVTTQQVPAFLDMYNIDPRNFVSSSTLAAGTVLAGVKQAATVRTLPGSPIRVDAQRISNGGIDTGFFGYWAIEEHHTTAIKSVRVGA